MTDITIIDVLKAAEKHKEMDRIFIEGGAYEEWQGHQLRVAHRNASIAGNSSTDRSTEWIRTSKPDTDRLSRLNRIDTLAAAHRLIEALAETTASRSEMAECRDVMARLEKIVEAT